jgi:hypothetical protein
MKYYAKQFDEKVVEKKLDPATAPLTESEYDFEGYSIEINSKVILTPIPAEKTK